MKLSCAHHGDRLQPGSLHVLNALRCAEQNGKECTQSNDKYHRCKPNLEPGHSQRNPCQRRNGPKNGYQSLRKIFSPFPAAYGHSQRYRQARGNEKSECHSIKTHHGILYERAAAQEVCRRLDEDRKYRPEIRKNERIVDVEGQRLPDQDHSQGKEHLSTSPIHVPDALTPLRPDALNAS